MAFVKICAEPRLVALAPGPGDAIAAVERSYQPSGEGSWLADVLSPLGPLIGSDLRILAFVAKISKDYQTVTVVDHAFANTEPEAFAALSDAAHEAPAPLLAASLGTPPVATNCQIAAAPVRHHNQQYLLRPLGANDLLGVRADVDAFCRIQFFAFSNKDLSLSRLRVSRLERIAAHLAAGYRLQGRSQQALDDAECIMDAQGRIVHAQGKAATRQARQRLVEGATRQTLARGRLRRESADKALEVWRGLVAGEWSLVDRRDTDGKRLLVARRNRPGDWDARALTLREKEVTALVLRLHSLQLIAYELGLSRSTVSSTLASAFRKLQVQSRAELVRAFSGEE